MPAWYTGLIGSRAIPLIFCNRYAHHSLYPGGRSFICFNTPLTGWCPGYLLELPEFSPFRQLPCLCYIPGGLL